MHFCREVKSRNIPKQNLLWALSPEQEAIMGNVGLRWQNMKTSFGVEKLGVKIWNVEQIKKSWKRIIQKMYSVAKHTLGTREQEATMSKVGLMWQLLVTNSDILLKICQLDSIHLLWSKNWVATADKNYSKLMSWNWNWTLILFDWGKIVAWRKKYPIRSLPAKVPKTRNIWTMEGYILYLL